ncbi:hypothetical protein [Fibrobacter sp. UWB13]|uniref:hypothetical protein n=1 Tax=Fibrobacter sp. UWB13 TaxID=1896204 RepID=UPI000A0B6946|nr:hypothetical protein [Fibrobacter sp. UWB13]SMG15971.1 hypothetical protein SAMN05720489_0793 [Fibrobacter sp. UWB13]
MNKKEAVELLRQNGIHIEGNITFASRNKGKDVYWINSEFSFLQNEWKIILNDPEEQKIRLVVVPAGAINRNIVRAKTSDANKTHIEIDCSDFVDVKSENKSLCFRQWIRQTIDY